MSVTVIQFMVTSVDYLYFVRYVGIAAELVQECYTPTGRAADIGVIFG